MLLSDFGRFFTTIFYSADIRLFLNVTLYIISIFMISNVFLTIIYIWKNFHTYNLHNLLHNR